MPRVLDRPTDRVRAVSTAIAQQETQLLKAVAEAREAGEPWEAIGRALGTSRQAAWERFYRAIETLRANQERSDLDEAAAETVAREALAHARRDRRDR
jgi:predicted S18 family serine protease